MEASKVVTSSTVYGNPTQAIRSDNSTSLKISEKVIFIEDEMEVTPKGTEKRSDWGTITLTQDLVVEVKAATLLSGHTHPEENSCICRWLILNKVLEHILQKSFQ